MPFLLILASALASQAAAVKSFDVSTLTIGAPKSGVELDLGKLKGDLRQIGWSEDGRQIYVQTAEGNPRSPKLHHYLIAAPAAEPTPIDAQPAWAAAYWDAKSAQSAPGVDLTIEIVSGNAITGLPRDGRPGDGADVGQFAAANSTTTTGTMVFRLLGEWIGEFVNTTPVPGLTFGWGPERSGAIAYVDRDGRVMLMDQRKQKTSIAGTKDAILPAWSADGTQIAYAQKMARRKYMLMIATVTR